MKKLELVLSALCLVLGAGVAWAATIDVTQANIEQYRTLQNGNTYRFAEHILLRAAATESALWYNTGHGEDRDIVLLV